MHPKNATMPTMLLQELFQRKLYHWASEDDPKPEPHYNWHVFADRDEALDYIRCGTERTGYGQEYDRVEYTLYKINVDNGGETIVPPPVTVLDVATEYGGHGVKIGLAGKGRDPQSVYWDSRGNSFVVVKPAETMVGDKRVVSDQGVVLASINGIGEVRWTVFATQTTWPENKEAVEHFGLTWSNA